MILDWYSKAQNIQFHRWTVSNFKQFRSCLLYVQKRLDFNMLDHPFALTVEVVDCYVTNLNIATNRVLKTNGKCFSLRPWVMFEPSNNQDHPFWHFQ